MEQEIDLRNENSDLMPWVEEEESSTIIKTFKRCT